MQHLRKNWGMVMVNQAKKYSALSCVSVCPQPSWGAASRDLHAGRMARQEEPLASHVVPAEIAKSVSHKLGGDFFPPGHVEIGVVQRLRDACSKRGSFRNGLLIQRLAHEGL